MTFLTRHRRIITSMEFLLMLLSCSSFISPCYAWFGGGKVMLSDVQVLTLKSAEMTTGRRNSPIPQLQCVGGSAVGEHFRPQVVQCYNRGFDGNDFQWECKTDMDNRYRFGRVEVICEGYDYPDDPYILKGSCGLEYTLDLTQEGFEKSRRGENYYYHHSDNKRNSVYSGYRSGLKDLAVLFVIGLVIYAIYKTCLSSPAHSVDTSTNDEYPGGGGWTNPRRRGGYFSGGDGQCGGGSGGYNGFWSGLGAGGLLGYMLGNTGNRNSYYGTEARYGNSSSWYGNESNRRASQSSSSGTRTASGFGGTRRR